RVFHVGPQTSHDPPQRDEAGAAPGRQLATTVPGRGSSRRVTRADHRPPLVAGACACRLTLVACGSRRLCSRQRQRDNGPTTDEESHGGPVTGTESGAERSPAAGRLAFRSRPSRGRTGATDEPLGIGVGRDGVLYVPETAERAAPVILFLHGAGGNGRRELRAVVAAADRYGTVVVAPDSRTPTWDVIAGRFGADVPFIDRVLDAVADRCDVDLDRLAVGGISDGASYALSLGLANGAAFGAIIAFSPGFMLRGPRAGRPRIYISHGTEDPVLPIDVCSRRLVPALEAAGYDVNYEEFEGGHTVPPVVADRAFAWWVS